jgi:hypothetical protein
VPWWFHFHFFAAPLPRLDFPVCFGFVTGFDIQISPAAPSCLAHAVNRLFAIFSRCANHAGKAGVLELSAGRFLLVTFAAVSRREVQLRPTQ